MVFVGNRREYTVNTWLQTSHAARASALLRMTPSTPVALVSFLFSSSNSSIVSLCPSFVPSTSFRTTRQLTSFLTYCKSPREASEQALECPTPERERSRIRILPACTARSHPPNTSSASLLRFYAMRSNALTQR